MQFLIEKTSFLFDIIYMDLFIHFLVKGANLAPSIYLFT